ncbi:helix-turn-helix transcriptional regulator [Paenibacillus sp. FSL R5-0701]|uniref:helix-turn-helix domain-containing protein n=1 Tax=Paenibacillus sp. FSL R5-0701 TaxID=2921654 RepID=UPI0030D01F3A
MEDNILGICPTCYLVVKQSDLHVLQIGSNTSVAYHRDCEPNRMKFMRRNKSAWENEGTEAKKLREKWGYSLSELAECIGVSSSKLRKYESGNPVTHAKLLGMAYEMFFRLAEREEQHK